MSGICYRARLKVKGSGEIIMPMVTVEVKSCGLVVLA